MVLHNVQNFQLFPNLIFELQLAGYVCMYIDAILHLTTPGSTKGRMYDICIT